MYGFCFMSVCLIKSNCYSKIYSSLQEILTWTKKMSLYQQGHRPLPSYPHIADWEFKLCHNKGNMAQLNVWILRHTWIISLWSSAQNKAVTSKQQTQGVTDCFIYADYNLLYLWNQTKLTSEGKENSLHNITFATL